MPCGKALGVDEVPVELLKIERVQELLLPILNKIDTADGVAPDELLLARLIAIFKNKSSATDANNYRGITLMSLCAKLRNKMLLLRIRPHLDPLLRANQNGFRPCRGTTQHVLALRRVFEQCRLKQGTRCVSVHRLLQAIRLYLPLHDAEDPAGLWDPGESCSNDHALVQRIEGPCHDC